MTDIQKFDIIETANPVLTVAPIEEETEMLGATDKITALYCRLSVEDMKEGKNGEKADESNSIQTQKMILLQYAKQNHFPNPTFFVDDGYSGVDFDNRPGFQQMLTEVKTGRVGTIITKDLSRLGRNSAMTSLYINIVFPKSGVRYIAINDHFDSIDMNSTECDMAGIKNWFNEFFAKDTSRKIRAVQKAKGERGVPLTTNVPYGYIKDKENPQTWLIDPEAASVVKRIFEMCMNGRGPSQIANQLKADGVLTPTAYKDSQGIKSPNTAPENPCGWNASTVVHILERREYTGCTVNFKTYTNSIWDKKQRETPLEKQVVFEDTHEAIIEKDVFDKVQIIRQQRQRKTKSGITSAFSGLVYCADCGEKLYYGATNNGKREGAFFDCSLHWKHKDKCGTHFIRESVLERMVLKHIQLVMGYILRYRQHFIFVMEQQLQLESAEKLQTSRIQLERNERRIAELKRLFIKIYEDNAKGNLSDERYEMMSQNYEAEQKQLEAEIVALRQEIEVQERQNENIERFIRTADKYVDIDEIDPCMLRELIKAIYVEAPDKSSGKRRQKIHIEYDGIGFIPLEELAKKETA